MSTVGRERHAVVIGGGIIGLACAHSLSQQGWRVTILEKGKLGEGSSGGNCGLVCPSHILPLAEPGMVGKTLGTLFHKNSPLKVRFRLDPAMWSWFFHFARRCNERDMIAAGHAIQPLLESSRSLYQELMEYEPIACEWETRGLLFAYQTQAALDAFRATDQLLAETFHCPAERLDGEELLAREPALSSELAGGWYYEDDAHLRPDKLMNSWRALLTTRGVECAEETSVQRFLPGPGRAAAVQTNRGAQSADAFVVATGALTPTLSHELGCRIPIQPGKGYCLTMPRPRSCPTIPLILPEHKVAVTPFQSGYRIGSTMEFAGYDTSLPPERLELLKDGARHYLNEPYCEPVVEQWYGWRPMTYDSVPIIDRAPAWENVWIAAGHNMLGLSMAPATGRLVAELLNGQTPHIDPTPYRVSRF